MLINGFEIFLFALIACGFVGALFLLRGMFSVEEADCRFMPDDSWVEKAVEWNEGLDVD